MTLVNQLRGRRKALKVEELADMLGLAVRTVYKEVEEWTNPILPGADLDPFRS